MVRLIRAHEPTPAFGGKNIEILRINGGVLAQKSGHNGFTIRVAVEKITRHSKRFARKKRTTIRGVIPETTYALIKQGELQVKFVFPVKGKSIVRRYKITLSTGSPF